MMRLLRMLGIALAMVMAVGFGLCGAFGVIGGAISAFRGGGEAGFVLPGLIMLFGLGGLVIATACVRLVRDVLNKKPDADRSPGR